MAHLFMSLLCPRAIAPAVPRDSASLLGAFLAQTFSSSANLNTTQSTWLCSAAVPTIIESLANLIICPSPLPDFLGAQTSRISKNFPTQGW